LLLRVLWSEFGEELMVVIGFLAVVVGGIGLGLSWAVAAFTVLAIVLVGAGVMLGVAGQAGHSLVAPLLSTTDAGHEPNACTNVAVGTGVGFSYLLLAGAASPDFGNYFDIQASHFPVVRQLYSAAETAFGAVIPDVALDWVAPAFDGYLPLGECVVLLLIAGVGTVRTLVDYRRWGASDDTPIMLPTMWLVGAAIALAIPILALLVFSAAADA